MITRQQVVDKGREYLGTKFQHQARIKGDRIDCAGLLICVGKELGLIDENFDFTNYDLLNDGADLKRIIELYADEIPISEMQSGDICIMMGGEYPQHCGFITDIGLLHCTRRVVEHAIDAESYNNIVSVHKLRGVSS